MSGPEDSRLSYLYGLLLDSMIEDEDSLLNRNIKELKIEDSPKAAKKIHDEKIHKLAEEQVKEEYNNNIIQKLILLSPFLEVKVSIDYLLKHFSRN